MSNKKISVLLSRAYKGMAGEKAKWFAAGSEIDLDAKEAKRLSGKGGCVEVVTREVVPEDNFATPLDAVKDAIEQGEVTGDGAPTVDALTARMKRRVTAEERDEWFAAVSEE